MRYYPLLPACCLLFTAEAISAREQSCTFSFLVTRGHIQEAGHLPVDSVMDLRRPGAVLPGTQGVCFFVSTRRMSDRAMAHLHSSLNTNGPT